jgi:hypothetical protein
MAERKIIVNGGSDNAREMASGDRYAHVRQTLFGGITDLVPAGTTEESLEIVEIPAGTLAANKSRLIVEVMWSLSATANRRKLKVIFASTTFADFDTSDTLSTAGHVRVVLTRESSTVIKAIASITIDGALNGTSAQYTRLTGLDLAANNYDMLLSLRNYTTATDSYIRSYSIELAPAP